MKNEVVTTGSIAIAHPKLGKKIKRRYREFTVSNETFNRFQTGRTKFERWSKYLNLEDAGEKEIYDFYNKTRNRAVIILRNETTGALRAIRHTSSNSL